MAELSEHFLKSLGEHIGRIEDAVKGTDSRLFLPIQQELLEIKKYSGVSGRTLNEISSILNRISHVIEKFNPMNKDYPCGKIR